MSRSSGASWSMMPRTPGTFSPCGRSAISSSPDARPNSPPQSGYKVDMRHVIHAAPLAAVAVLLAACSNGRRNDAVDSSLTRDLQLASQIATQPTFQDTALVPAAKAPPKASPRRTPAPTPQTRHERPIVRTPEAPVVVAEQAKSQTPALITAPEPAPAPAPSPSRAIAAGVGMSMTAGGRI